MNIYNCYKEAMDLLVSKLSENMISEETLYATLIEDEHYYRSVVGYLDGYCAAKGFGFDNNTTDWLDNKLKGE